MDRSVMETLLRKAYLYDDPAAYRAGVEAAWRVLAPPLAEPPRQPLTSQPAQPGTLTSVAR